MRQRAFSLLELLAVLALVGMIAVVVLVNFGSTLHNAKAEQAIGRFLLIDRQMRHYSQRFRRATELTLDLDRGQLIRVDVLKRKPIGAVVHLPGSVRIDRFISSESEIRRGAARIQFTPFGQTPTYAIRMRRPENKTAWLLFVGLTGQVHRDLTEKEVYRTLRLVSSQP